METYAHAFFTWAASKYGVRSGGAAAVSGALGSVLPDVPAFLGVVYFTGAGYLREGWDALSSERVLDAIYFTGPFGATGSALHSLVPAAALILLYPLLRLGRLDGRRVLLWFLIGWAGHTVADFLTHVDDTRPLFWPVSGWEWSSPVSYYDPDHYGGLFFLLEHGAIVVAALALIVRRRLRGRRPRAPG